MCTKSCQEYSVSIVVVSSQSDADSTTADLVSPVTCTGSGSARRDQEREQEECFEDGKVEYFEKDRLSTPDRTVGCDCKVCKYMTVCKPVPGGGVRALALVRRCGSWPARPGVPLRQVPPGQTKANLRRG